MQADTKRRIQRCQKDTIIPSGTLFCQAEKENESPTKRLKHSIPDFNWIGEVVGFIHQLGTAATEEAISKCEWIAINAAWNKTNYGYLS